MSSLAEKSQPLSASVAAAPSIVATSKPAAAAFFFRSDSIRKIKCTAVYPFQVAGVKLSKDALIELLENNIKKARICTQKTMLNFYYVVLKLLSTLFALWGNKVSVKATLQPTTVDETSSTKANATTTSLPAASGPVDSYQTRLEEKLAKIQKHKSRLNGNRLIPPTFSSDSATTLSSRNTPANRSSFSDSTTCLSGSRVGASADQLRPLTASTSSLLVKSRYQEYGLALCVHAGLVIMYLQLVILGIALNTTNVPTGLIFMLVTVLIIGYIFVKVSFLDGRSASTKSPRSSPQPKAKGSRRSTEAVKGGDSSPERQSRSKAKKYKSLIELKYQTLSKIKLL